MAIGCNAGLAQGSPLLPILFAFFNQTSWTSRLPISMTTSAGASVGPLNTTSSRFKKKTSPGLKHGQDKRGPVLLIHSSLQTLREGANLIVQQSEPRSVIVRHTIQHLNHVSRPRRPTCGTASCVVLGLECDARNMVILTTEIGRRIQQNEEEGQRKAFENQGRRP